MKLKSYKLKALIIITMLLIFSMPVAASEVTGGKILLYGPIYVKKMAEKKAKFSWPEKTEVVKGHGIFGILYVLEGKTQNEMIKVQTKIRFSEPGIMEGNQIYIEKISDFEVPIGQPFLASYQFVKGQDIPYGKCTIQVLVKKRKILEQKFILQKK